MIIVLGTRNRVREAEPLLMSSLTLEQVRWELPQKWGLYQTVCMIGWETITTAPAGTALRPPKYALKENGLTLGTIESLLSG